MLIARGLTATETIMIKATPAENGHDFLTDMIAGTEDPKDVVFTDPDGDNIYTGLFPVTLDDDEDGEATGTIKLTLSANTGVYILTSDNEGVITILDDDAPELKITAGAPVTEGVGAMANFIISAAVSPDDMITVRYNVTETADFVATANKGTDKPASLDFSNGAKVATLSIPIENDSQKEDNGTITVTLIADTASPITYLLAPAADNEAVVTISDDDSLPVIEIMADSGDVEENSNQAKFKLTATGLTEATRLLINATPENVDNNFLSTSIAGVPAAYPVDFDDQGDGIYVGELAVTFIKANVNQTGDLKLTINVDPNPAQTYLLGSTTMGVITVIYVGLPELSIAGGNPVTEAEGAVATFLISASRSPNTTITLHYNLTESGNFIDIEGDNKDASLDFSNQVTEVILPIPIVNDTERENSGTITVTINEDTGTPQEYEVAATPRNIANVMVIDDESIPVIEIIPESGSVAENGGPAKFKLVAGRLSATTTLMINATPAEGTDEAGNDHDFLAASVENTESIFTVEFSDQGNGIYFGELAVAVDNDDVGEATGTIKLTIHENQAKTYQLGSVTEGTITVWDDDAPELSISGKEIQ